MEKTSETSAKKTTQKTKAAAKAIAKAIPAVETSKTIHVDVDVEESVTPLEVVEPELEKPEWPDTREMIRQHRVALWLALAFFLTFAAVWTWAVFFSNGAWIQGILIGASSVGLAVVLRSVITNMVDIGDFKAIYRRETAVDYFAKEQ